MTKLKPEGRLALSGPRELIAARSVAGAYEPGGAAAADTLRLRGAGPGERGRNWVPERLPDQEVVGVCEEPVVWAGGMVAHYGHFLIDSVSRLWPLLPGAELEGLPVVFATPLEHERAFEWLDAFGARRVELPERGAIRFSRMYVPEPAWRIDAWAAPEIRQIHLHVRGGLDVPVRPRCGALWLSRSRLKRRRRIYDECLLEWVLGEHVTIFHPEEKTFAEQVAAIEAADAVLGVIGSAFHTFLMVRTTPDCLYLCPSPDTTHSANHQFQAAYAAQDRMLGVTGTYVDVCVLTGLKAHRFPGGYRLSFPASHRLLIPETLLALDESMLPGLLDDPRASALAYPEQARRAKGGQHSDLESAAVALLLDPLSADVRMRLGVEFEAAGLGDCALEQYMAVADLADDPVPALLRAAELFEHEGETEQASAITEQIRGMR